jgi:predicted MFS family arabinose efflux permease
MSVVPAESWRNVAILSAAQALAASAGPFVTLAGGIIGQSLAPSRLLATLPITALIMGLACAAVPAALLIRRVGRRNGFVIGAAVSATGALLAARATAAGSFAAFCAATLVMGAAGAFVQQYRFAAAESVDRQHTGRAVSLVLVGGIIAGVLGPEIGRRGRFWFGDEFSGAFVIVAIVQIAAMALLMNFQDPAAVVTAGPRERVPLRAFFARKTFALAVIAAGTASAIMSFLMTATPISMHVHDAHSIDDAAFVIQSHVIAMFAPSLVTGWLVDRLGVTRMMAAGALLLGAAIAAGASSQSVSAYWTGLVLLGLGWNLLFIGATVLLAQSLEPAERFRGQGLNDFTVFTSSALASLAAGAVLHRFGWTAMNLAAAPVLALVLLLVAKRSRSRSMD